LTQRQARCPSAGRRSFAAGISAAEGGGGAGQVHRYDQQVAVPRACHFDMARAVVSGHEWARIRPADSWLSCSAAGAGAPPFSVRDAEVAGSNPAFPTRSRPWRTLSRLPDHRHSDSPTCARTYGAPGRLSQGTAHSSRPAFRRDAVEPPRSASRQSPEVPKRSAERSVHPPAHCSRACRPRHRWLTPVRTVGVAWLPLTCTLVAWSLRTAGCWRRQNVPAERLSRRPPLRRRGW
jgi:hypothetical protein